MLRTDKQLYIDNKPNQIRSLYEKYASMLLGYIIGVVKDQKIAEDYLVMIFAELSQQSDSQVWESTNNWCQLLRFAKDQLREIANTTAIKKSELSDLFIQNTQDKYLSDLNEEQKKVFTDTYYLGKSTNAISIELNKPEVSIRKTLKEAFAVIKKGCEN
ncbi:hypothetical protein [Pedobacter sp. GR22-6]|uniref:hypothetical protein n=1 Tax=Pedobacter sp. GR22-6 TaxID=3127957 RepID=UPI00307E3BD2